MIFETRLLHYHNLYDVLVGPGEVSLAATTNLNIRPLNTEHTAVLESPILLESLESSGQHGLLRSRHVEPAEDRTHQVQYTSLLWQMTPHLAATSNNDNQPDDRGLHLHAFGEVC
jgi:hypothetical protein